MYFLLHTVQTGSGAHISRQDERPGFESRQGQKTLLHVVQTGPEAHPASCSKSNEASSPGGKAAGA
jgi:hypothetical protein